MREPHVDDRAALLLGHHPQTLGDRSLDLLRTLDDAREGAASRRGDSGIVRRRIEAQIEIAGAAGEAVGMKGEG